MANAELQSAVNKAGNALFDVAALLKKNSPDLPTQNREIMIRLAIDAWLRAGGSH